MTALTRRRLDADVAVIGSGFAGVLAALALIGRGRRVVIVERGRHPRFAIGESTTPLTNLLLEEFADTYDLPRVRAFSKWGTWQQTHPDVACGLDGITCVFPPARGTVRRHRLARSATADSRPVRTTGLPTRTGTGRTSTMRFCGMRKRPARSTWMRPCSTAAPRTAAPQSRSGGNNEVAPWRWQPRCHRRQWSTGVSGQAPGIGADAALAPSDTGPLHPFPRRGALEDVAAVRCAPAPAGRRGAASRLPRWLDLGPPLQQRHHERRRRTDRRTGRHRPTGGRCYRPGTACSTRCRRCARSSPRPGPRALPCTARAWPSALGRSWVNAGLCCPRRRGHGSAAVDRTRSRCWVYSGCSTCWKRRRPAPLASARSPN